MAAIITHSGRMVELLGVSPEDIDLDDIAHALAHINRFTGHAKRAYSVAEHSLNVARLLPEPIKIYGLLHDCHEAYVGDISTPLKKSLEERTNYYFHAPLKGIVDQIDAAIYEALKVPPPGTLVQQAVKWADATMALKEMRELFDKPPPVGQFGVDETLPVPDWEPGGYYAPSYWADSFKGAVLQWAAR